MHFAVPVLSLMRARLAWAQAAELEGLWWRPLALYTGCRCDSQSYPLGGPQGLLEDPVSHMFPQREAYAESEIESPCSLQEEAAVPSHAPDLVFGL